VETEAPAEAETPVTPAAFSNPSSSSDFAVWDGAGIRIRNAIAGLESQVRIVWFWTRNAWVSYAPPVPAGFNVNFNLGVGSILWVVGI
jgi:hypothetical protein